MAVRTYNTNMKRSRYAHMSYIDRSYTSEKQLRKCTRHIVFSQKTSPQIVRGWHDKMNQAPRAFCSFLYCLCVWRGIATLPSFLLIRHHFILADFTKLQTKLLATTDYKKSLFFQRLKCCCLLSTFFFFVLLRCCEYCHHCCCTFYVYKCLRFEPISSTLNLYFQTGPN